MRTFKRSRWRRLKRAYWYTRAWLYHARFPDPWLGFNPWRVRISEDEAAHGEWYTTDEVFAELRSRAPR